MPRDFRQPQPTRVATTARALTAVTALLLMASPFPAAAADEHLETVKLGKAAVACQKVIAQVSAKVLAGKLKALDACANAALACVQTQHDKPDCLTKAGSACAKQLGKAALALTKAQAKIVAAKSCGIELRLPDLLSDDGLGLGSLAGDCQTDYALDVCGGLAPLAECLVRNRDRAAGEIFGQARPRTGELLTLFPNPLPAVAGVPPFTGCATCGAPPEKRKAVEQCGKALTKARQGLGASLEKTLLGCAQKVLGCLQTKSGDPKCLTGATAGCSKATDTIAGALSKFAAGVAKKCAAAAVDFATLGDPSGLGLAALDAVCTSAPTDAASVAACLQARARCTSAELVRRTIARADEFAESGHLGTLAPDVTAVCPTPVPGLVARTGGSRVVFGGISKFLKLVRRTAGSFGTTLSGGRPTPSVGAARGITRVSGPTRFTFGGVGKIQFRYKTGAALARGARAADPPRMIVAIRRADVALDDHIEVALDPPPGESEVDDEIEVTYQDTIPGCAFELALATRIDGVVSDYTTLPQVLDTTLPPPSSPVVTQIIDESGDGAGHTLNDALGLAIDSQGTLYVAGAASNNVLRRDSAGTITQILDTSGDGIGHGLIFPSALAIRGSGNLFVASQAPAPDSYVFKKELAGGAITKVLDPSGDGVASFSSAGGITSNLAEIVFVSGTITDNVFGFEGSTIFLLLDATGDGTHALSAPRGLAVDDETDDVYVAGSLSNNVFRIAPEGAIPTQIIDANGDGVHPLGEPVDVAVDADSNVYVVGSATSNVFKITPGGVITQIIDASGAGSGGFAEPVAIAVDETGVYVLGGASSRRAFKIRTSGEITEILGPAGDGVHPFEIPGDIATDGDGNVYVSDRANRVFKIVP